jgi:type VI secretion system protein ImpF
VAELVHQEHLQPSLLDRLADDDPQSKVESRDQRVLSLRRLRECVLRDLSWLLNSSSLPPETESTEYPLVAHSVINYGIPDLSGQSSSGADVEALGRVIRQAIWDFEPRILRNSVRVRAVAQDPLSDHNTLLFEIEGELWAEPVPLHLYLRTEIDLESGNVALVETRGGDAA